LLGLVFELLTGWGNGVGHLVFLGPEMLVAGLCLRMRM